MWKPDRTAGWCKNLFNVTIIKSSSSKDRLVKISIIDVKKIASLSKTK